MKHFFIDANIFIYFITGKERLADRCQTLLEKTIEGEVRSFTSVLVLNEVTHKLMTLELADKLNQPPHIVMRKIREDNSVLEKIDETWKDLIRIMKIDNLTILENDMNNLLIGSTIAKENNLLITDSMHLASTDIHGIEVVATTDKRMKELEFVEVWDPSELDFNSYLSRMSD